MEYKTEDQIIEERKQRLCYRISSKLYGYKFSEYGTWHIFWTQDAEYVEGHLDDVINYVAALDIWEWVAPGDSPSIEKVEIKKKFPRRIDSDCDDVI